MENQIKGLDKGRRKQLLHKASDNTGSGRYNPSWVRKSGLRYTVLRWNIRPVRPSRPSSKLYTYVRDLITKQYHLLYFKRNSYLTKPMLCQSRYAGYANVYYYKYEMVPVCLFCHLIITQKANGPKKLISIT